MCPALTHVYVSHCVFLTSPYGLLTACGWSSHWGLGFETHAQPSAHTTLTYGPAHTPSCFYSNLYRDQHEKGQHHTESQKF